MNDEPVVPARDDVHIWVVRPGLAPAGTELSVNEWERARAYRLREDRERFVSARVALRVLLATRLGLPPASLQFAYGPLGKPELAGYSGPTFNVAHSGRLALIAIAESGPLGVDVEDLSLPRDHERLANVLFSEPERRAWTALEQRDRVRALLQTWTRHEALAKAVGAGLSLSDEDRAAALAGPDRFYLWDIALGDDAVAALATPYPAPHVLVREFGHFSADRRLAGDEATVAHSPLGKKGEELGP